MAPEDARALGHDAANDFFSECAVGRMRTAETGIAEHAQHAVLVVSQGRKLLRKGVGHLDEAVLVGGQAHPDEDVRIGRIGSSVGHDQPFLVLISSPAR